MAAGDAIWALSIALLLGGAWLVYMSRRNDNARDDSQLRQLEARGYDLSKAHEISFLLFVPDEPAARDAAARLAGEGYECRVEPGMLERHGGGGAGRAHASDNGFLVTANSVIVLDGVPLRVRRTQFNALARALNGSYLGWTPAEPLDRELADEDA